MTETATQSKPSVGATPQDVLASHFTLVSQPGAIEEFDFEGVEGWTSPDPHPVLSIGRWTTDDRALAADGLAHVVEMFRDAGRGFDWMTGPRCAQNGLLSLLDDHGFLPPPLQVAAMAKTIAPHDAPTPPEGMRVWKVTDPSDSRIWSVMARGFDVPDSVGKIFHDAYMNTSDRQWSDVYAVSLDGDEAPVGVGYLSYIGDGPAVLLRVSSTLEAARGRGIYKALVNSRLHDAANKGRTQAFVHAYSIGSQRCLEQLGFENTGTLQLHRWRP